MSRQTKILAETCNSEFLFSQSGKDGAKIIEGVSIEQFEKAMNQYAAELIKADRKDAAEKAEIHYPAANNLNPSVNRDSILNRPLPEELTK